MARRVLLSLGLGIAATAVLFGLAYAAEEAGLDNLTQVLIWQNTLLQSFVPLINIGTPGHPFYAGSPLNFLALLASMPLGILVYGAVAFVVLGKTQLRR